MKRVQCSTGEQEPMAKCDWLQIRTNQEVSVDQWDSLTPMSQMSVLDLWRSTDISRFDFQSSASLKTSQRRFEGFPSGCVARMSAW